MTTTNDADRAAALLAAFGVPQQGGEEGRPVTKTPPLSKGPLPPPLPYTYEEVLEFLVANPSASAADVAARFQRTRGWFMTVLATDRFQLLLDPVRGALLDPVITATLEERWRSLTLHALSIVGTKLDSPEVSDMLALKAVDLGVKALGMGRPAEGEEKPTTPQGIDALADRLTAALDKQHANIQARKAATVQIIEAAP